MTRPLGSLNGSPLFVGITGGRGSGKSTLARTLAAALGPEQAVVLAHDAYFRDPDGLPAEARAALDYDVPDAYDHALLLRHLAALRAGRPIRSPRYCLLTHRRLGDGALVEPRPIVIVEGVLLLWEPAVRAAFDLTIYLDAPERVRLERRLARDVADHGPSADGDQTQFSVTVREAHRAWVEPTPSMADLVLSTAGRLEPLAEIALAIILDRVARPRGERVRLAS